MDSKINIQLIEKIKAPENSSPFIKGIFWVLGAILYPLILIFGFLFMLGIRFLSIFQSSENEDTQKDLEISNQSHIWGEMTSHGNLKLFHRYKDEIRFGPAYFEIKSEPQIKQLEGKIFGDWFFKYKNGIFLQQWNSKKSPDTNLLFLDGNTLEVQVIENNIPSILWEIAQNENDEIILNCDSGKETLTYLIKIKNR